MLMETSRCMVAVAVEMGVECVFVCRYERMAVGSMMAQVPFKQATSSSNYSCVLISVAFIGR